MTILVTGVAGFIGFHVTSRLLEMGLEVVGIDNMNDYYSVELKNARLNKLSNENFQFFQIDLSNITSVTEVFKNTAVTKVIHLAAQAGVRYSIENPQAYVKSNLVGFFNILENCRRESIDHLIYASSSSVYGLKDNEPFNESDFVDHPVSFYAATKKSNEVMAHSYSHLYNLPTTGLRFFTVYGPWGRPDMAYFSFTKSILEHQPIRLFNNGEMLRDFTYIDDIVDGVCAVLDKLPKSGSTREDKIDAPYRILNIGNNEPIDLRRFIAAIEKSTGEKALIKNFPMQPGDVKITYANIDKLSDLVGYNPSTSVEEGINNFVVWYKSFYRDR